MPTQIGPYRVDREIGRGGMGVVYLARDERLDREVAIKCLPDDFGRDAERLERFDREARLLASLNHPNIATVHGLEELDGKKYLVLEYIDGESLTVFLRQHCGSWRKRLEVACGIADALAAAHARGVAHRDVKPDNVRVTGDGQVKVLDFGLACTVSQSGNGDTDATTVARETRPGAVLGTPGYMAPEQARGQPADARTDIFAFGCLLYEMLTRRPAFGRETTADSLAATLQEDVEPPSRVAGQIPAELDAIVMRCLEKRPDDRFQSARDLAFSLRTIMGEREPPSGARSRLPAAPRRWHRLVAAGLALTAIAVASVWLLWPRPPLQSLAVLPFINESGDEDAAFLCDGIAESIINRLATIPDLRVVPSTTAFHFRGEEDLNRVAHALDVRALLTGRLIKQGDQLTIRVSLDDVQENSRLWGEPFSARLDNVLEVEADIADQVAEELRLRLAGDERSRLARGGTTVPDAHLAYMRGRYFGSHRDSTEDDWKAVAQFERAIELDPAYARPYCGLVDSKCILAGWGALQPLEIRGEVQAYVGAALALDDTLAEAHVSAGIVAMYLNWDWAAAEAAFERAIALDPGLASAYVEYGLMLAWTGRHEEAEKQYRAGIRANPVSAEFLYRLGWLYSGTGRLAEAVGTFNEALELDPDHHAALIWLGDVRLRQGRFAEGVALVERAVLSRERPELPVLAHLSHAYAMAGRVGDAEELLSRMQQEKDETPAHHLWFAEVYAALGEVDEAFAALDRAVAAREAWLPNLRFEPGLIHIRNDPRFAEVHRKMGLGHVDLSWSQPVGSAPRQAGETRRLAVLPFDLVGNVPDAEFLADEIPASIIDSMAPLPELSLVPRSISFRFRSGEYDTASIGQELNADLLLTGRILVRGDDLRIRAELIDVASNSQLWGQPYDRSLADTLAVEREITQRIISGLQLQITGEEQSRLDRRRPVNAEAHAAYLEGRFWWNKKTPEGLQRALALYERAAELDEEYALAHAGQAMTHVLMYPFSRNPDEILPKMLEAANRAIQLDQTIADAYAVRGQYETFRLWNWEAGEAAFRRAIELDPNNAVAHHWFTNALVVMGRHDEARSYIERAAKLDPASLSIQRDRGIPDLWGSRDFEAARRHFERALAMDPDFMSTRVYLAEAILGLGRTDEAIEHFREAILNDRASPWNMGGLGRAYGQAGRREEAIEELTRLTELAQSRHVPSTAFAEVHLGLGNMDAVYEWLNRAIEERDVAVALLNVNPAFDAARDDARFRQLLKRIGFPERDDRDKASSHDDQGGG